MDDVFDALSHPTRRRVLEILKGGGRTAGQLASAFPVSKPTMSAHFAVLVAAGLIEPEKQGRTITYRLKLSVLEDALLAFAQKFGLQISRPEPGKPDPSLKEEI